MFFHFVNGYDYVDESTGDTNLHIDLCSYVPYREYSLSNIIDPARPFIDGTLVQYELAAVNNGDINKPGGVTVFQAIPHVSTKTYQ